MTNPPYFQNEFVTIHQGDAVSVLRSLPQESVQTVVTSPPYWGLRDYGVDGQIGLEKNLQEYIEKIVLVFSFVWEVLKEDGTVWLNMGDCYCNRAQSGGGDPTIGERNLGGQKQPKMDIPFGLKPKDLVGLPWRVAFALQNAGWFLRSDIIWSKPNPMPESVRDRPTRAHEYIFLFSKSEKYFYNADAIRTPQKPESIERRLRGKAPVGQRDFPGVPQQIHKFYNKEKQPKPSGWDRGEGRKSRESKIGRYSHKPEKKRGHFRPHEGFNGNWDLMKKEDQMSKGANKRSVWTVATQGYPGAHFATFPAALIEPCILAGSAPGDTVLDPFAGTGTTCEVAEKHGRKSIAIELNPNSCELASQRFQQNSFCFL